LEAQGIPYAKALDQAAVAVSPLIATRRGKDEAYAEMFGQGQAETAKQTSQEGRTPDKAKYTKNELDIAKKLGGPYYDAMVKELKK